MAKIKAECLSLDDDIRWLVAIIFDSGMRLSEAAGLMVDDLKLKEDIPFYNGRVGDDVKFVYREYSNDMARSAFSQQAQYDLNLSNIIAFKSAKLKIIEATNEFVVYEVLSHFNEVH